MTTWVDSVEWEADEDYDRQNFIYRARFADEVQQAHVSKIDIYCCEPRKLCLLWSDIETLLLQNLERAIANRIWWGRPAYDHAA